MYVLLTNKMIFAKHTIILIIKFVLVVLVSKKKKIGDLKAGLEQ